MHRDAARLQTCALKNRKRESQKSICATVIWHAVGWLTDKSLALGGTIPFENCRNVHGHKHLAAPDGKLPQLATRLHF
jgi:hypothetical protein